MASKLIRVSEETYNRLREYHDRLAKALEAGTLPETETVCDPINPLTGMFTFDTLVSRLLDQVDKHRERAKRSRAKKKK